MGGSNCCRSSETPWARTRAGLGSPRSYSCVRLHDGPTMGLCDGSTCSSTSRPTRQSPDPTAEITRGHAQARFTVIPLTPDRWADFETLFGERGACGGCWCTFWRVPAVGVRGGKGDGNRAPCSHRQPGRRRGSSAISGRAGRLVSPSPRGRDYPGPGSVARPQAGGRRRRSGPCRACSSARTTGAKGLSVQLLKAAVEHVKSRAGGRRGLPVEPKRTGARARSPGPGWRRRSGRPDSAEVARRSDTRPIMRYQIRKRLQQPGCPPR